MTKTQKSSIDAPTLALVFVYGTILAFLSVRRYAAYNAGMFDLGNMAQAIWSATQGRPLIFSWGFQHSRLALHVEIIYFLIAPFYALFKSPAALLILQSALFSLGSVPIYRMTRRRFNNPWIPRLIVACYLFYPVAQTAVLFDFHGDTLAAPLLLFAINAWDRGSLRAYALWLLLALSCKFYVSAAVAVLGIVLLLKGDKRTGFWTLVAGLAWGSLTFFVVKPWASTHLTSASATAATPANYLSLYFGYVQEVIHPAHLMPRLATLVLVIVPALWVGHRAPVWWLPAAATILPSLVSSRGSYDYRFHHYALSVPFMVVATIYGAKRIRGSHIVPEIAMQVAITLLLAALLVDIPINPLFWTSPPGWGWDSWAYGRTSRDALKDHWLKENVPERAPLSASFFIAPHVINRSRIVALTHPTSDRAANALTSYIESTEWVVADALFDYVIPDEDSPAMQRGIPLLQQPVTGIGHPGPADGGVLYDRPAIRMLLAHDDFDLIAARDGLLLFGRKGLSEIEPLSLNLDRSEVSGGPAPMAAFEGQIGLIDFDLEEIDSSRYRLTYRWTALESMEGDPPYFAVSELVGVPDARFVHLPTMALYPNDTWQPGEIVREQFEVRIPDDVEPGRYPLQVGWYDSSHLYAAWTDARSRIGTTARLTHVTIAP